MTEFYVKVETDSDEFKIEGGKIPRVCLTAPARNGKANSELITQFEEILGCRPAIVSGHTSKRKKIAVNVSSSQIKDKISDDITIIT